MMMIGSDDELHNDNCYSEYKQEDIQVYYQHSHIFAMIFSVLVSSEVFDLDIVSLCNSLIINKERQRVQPSLQRQLDTLNRIKYFMEGIRHSIYQHWVGLSFRWLDLEEIIRINIHLLFGDEFSQFDKLQEYKIFSQKIFHKLINMQIPQLKHSDMMRMSIWAFNVGKNK